MISMFFGIVIKMYYREHNPPHSHAYYQGFEAIFDINSGKLIEGSLPNKAKGLVSEWALEHRHRTFR